MFFNISVKERGTKSPFVRLLDMKKKERMKIYTLLLGALFVSPTQAQTMHDWENYHVLQINREPARAAFTPFSVQKGDGSISLDGTWKFRWTPVPNERVVNFYQINFDDKDWTDFPVPANWEVNGYGTPIYVSAGYPFKIDPPRVMGEPKTDYTTYKERNPVGQYRRTFVLPTGWEVNGQTFLRFEGVMSAFYVWINGERVGYSQGSMEPSEFNVTKYLKSGENQISLEVYRYSDGSYLEDQDFWRFGGIHRSIHLIHTPDIHVRDYAVRTLPASAGDYEDFILQIDPQFSVYRGMTGKGYVLQGVLKDASGKEVATLKGNVEDILDLEHKASRMNEWYPQRGPRVIRIAACFSIVLSFIPKFSAIISTMPAAIIGGVSFMLYGMISAIGVRNVVENKVDLTKSRNLIIAGVIFVCGLGFSDGLTFTVFGTSITLTALAVAAIAGIFLNAVLPGNDYQFGKNPEGDRSRGVYVANSDSEDEAE